MSEETNHGIEPAVMKNEHKSGEGCATNSCDKENSVAGCFPKLDGHESLTTGNELPGGCNLVGKSESMQVEESTVTRSQEDPVSSPMKSFQSLYSSQSSAEGVKEMKMISYVSPLKVTGVVQFEDTLSEEDHSHFDLIYESLLFEGKAGNLNDLAVCMALHGSPQLGF